MKNFSTAVRSAIGAGVLLVFAGCAFWGGSASEGETAARLAEIDRDAHDTVIALGRESGDRLLTAFQKNDFALTESIPVGDEKNTLTRQRFDEVVKKVIEANGGIREFAYLADLNTPPYKMLLWKVTFTPGKAAPEAADAAGNAAADAAGNAAENTGVDMLFELWMGKLDGQYRVVGFRFKL